NDHHQPNQEDIEEEFEATDDFINSSAGYARTAKTGDRVDDDATSISKPFPNICLPSEVLQEVKNLAPEDALNKLLATYSAYQPNAADKEKNLQLE
ncbi:hypothetical protein A2U01_0060403, partial [Trifolium medium]|nr:hypothetical protein [Trifolium medium]